MRITFDPRKRDQTLADRGVDFADAAEVFEGVSLNYVDDRRDYGKQRIVTIGTFRGRMVVIVWTPRGEARHVISMRKANDREKNKFARRLGEA